MRPARVAKIVFGVLAGLLAAGLVAPKFHADGYHDRIQTALENALARKVSFDEIRFNLLTGPGFTVKNVVIEEDPALGAEPILYVGQLEAIPRLWSLFTGHLAFSSLRLEDAYLNLSRADVGSGEYRWNFETLLRPAVVAAFPNISLRGARINFKAGNVKSMVYLLDSDLDVTPPSSEGEPWRFQFQGKPARADRPARGSGSFRAKGNWRPGVVDLDLQLESSELGDMVALVRGEDIGLHGLISGRAKLQGPTTAVRIEGRMRVEDLHGWDQSIPKGESWPLDLHGRWNFPAQQLELDARVAGQSEKPILNVHYLVNQYGTQPRWGVSIELNRMGVEPLVPLARHLGAQLPDGLRFTGIADGVIGYSQNGFNGQASLHQAKVALPGSPPLQVEEAQVLVDNGHVRLRPARVVSVDQEEALVDADYNITSQSANVKIASRGMNVAALGKQASLAAAPLLSQLGAGQWSGELNYAAKTGEVPMWSGDVVLTDATVPFPGFSDPVLLQSAHAHLDERGVFLDRIRATAAGIPVRGEYSYEEGKARPHHFDLTVDAIAGADLENVFMPVLRRSSGLLGIAMRFGRRAAVPEWLANWHAEGLLHADKLSLAPLELDRVRARVLWDTTHVAMPDLSARMGSGMVKSRVYIDLRNGLPAYEAFSNLAGVEWKGGRLDADAVLQTRGTGSALIANLRSNGSFAGRSVLDDVETVTGKYEFGWKGPAPQLTLSDLRLAAASGSYTGSGSLQDDGTLLLQLTSGARQMRVAGTLASQGALHWLQ
ncbi:MAG: hypothetical protein JWO80_5863 [Bryobacterales bacterium]|nr:hypothetical protein [Bryobacterales bacterium]